MKFEVLEILLSNNDVHSSFILHQHQVSLTGDAVVMVRLVVAVKRKLQLYYWKSRKFNPLRDDLSLPDVPRALTWCKEAIAVAFKHDYWLVMVRCKFLSYLSHYKNC